MSLIICDCPRCDSSKITFDVLAAKLIDGFLRYDWQYAYEAFSICRRCSRSTVFIIILKKYEAAQTFSQAGKLLELRTSLNEFFDVDGYISLENMRKIATPDHLPLEIASTFEEGAACHGIGCHNAAATMFRLCLDMATKPLLPADTAETADPSKMPNAKQRRDLGLRLRWLFDHQLLPNSLAELASCIREDANDGAHVGNLTQADAEDLLDLTSALLERMFTEPKRLSLALERRVARRTDSKEPS